ncbi:anti-sigma factor [bacterium]|nr:anti-sigma factor [bacterium]
MLKHEYLESLPLYALGCLSGADKNELETHLNQGCDICEPELRMFQETGARLPYALPNSKLPADLKDKIWSRIEAEPQPQPRKSSSTWALLSFAAVIVLAAIGTIWFLQLNEQLFQRERELGELQQLLLQQRKEIDWLRDPSVQLALLTGMNPVPQAKGKMLWNPQASRGMFYVNLLPPLSAEKSYQLWVIGNKGPVSAGVFYPNSQGSAVVTISRIEGIAEGALQFAVTIEPRGGVPQPTGSMVLAGKAL